MISISYSGNHLYLIGLQERNPALGLLIDQKPDGRFLLASPPLQLVYYELLSNKATS
jgi:hypothetical protein